MTHSKTKLCLVRGGKTTIAMEEAKHSMSEQVTARKKTSKKT